jgi:hypothetical protein
MKHSKGTWYAVDYAGFINIQDKDDYFAHNLLDCKDIGEETAKANGELMANAPVLLEKLIQQQKNLELLINAVPSGERRNKLTEENIDLLIFINQFR